VTDEGVIRTGDAPAGDATTRAPDRRSRIAWRSPVRGPWLTSVLGLLLLVGFPLVAVTGLISYIAYEPRLGTAIPANVGWLHLPYFDWPTNPAWLYQLTQGVHVQLGLVLTPIVLAKLWSVMPRLFSWPRRRTLLWALERVSLLLLVGSVLFEIGTGILYIQYDALAGFPFYAAHYIGAWVFIASFVAHVVLKLPAMIRALRSRSLRRELRTDRAAMMPEPLDESGLVSRTPDAPTISRRGVLGLALGGSALLAVLFSGEAVGGLWARLSVLSPRSEVPGRGSNDFQVNWTANTAGITASDVGPNWRLILDGGARPVELDRTALIAMQLHTVRMPLTCVEGWSTTQTWTGVRLADLAALAGVPQPTWAQVESLQKEGGFRSAKLARNQILDPHSLLAVQVNGADLSLDHGYPARVIVPALPGVHNTKWVSSIHFEART
jgi:DMSO/TMAO reductase YedYZ molybdopterin-dependent catalytic subunit